MKKLCFLFILFLIQISGIHGQVIIPTPQKEEILDTYFESTSSFLKVYVEDTLIAPSTTFLNQITDKRIYIVSDKKKADVRLIKSKECSSEGYNLKVTPRQIKIEASDKAGYIYAFQTLLQLKDTPVKEKDRWRCARITDRPRTKWRGFMLDSGRQYQSVVTIKKYIDLVSILKMNVFHWHLTEGLGWRLEIKKYPELTRKGAFVGVGKEQQGFYTQEEVREIVEYAGQRNITIVPEIDMPGHAEAALASYPENGCFGQPVEIPREGFTKNIFCAGKEHTIRFLKDILDEVCELFPSPYIHLGGDEAPKDNWNECPDCRKRIQKLELEDTHALQLWFSAEMANYLKKKGRKAVFWDDVILHTNYPLPDNVVIQWWNYRGHGDEGLRKAQASGCPVICSTNYYNYLNFPVTPWKGYEQNRTFNLQDAYTQNPSYKAIMEDHPLTLGMTCALWTDYELLESMLDNRLFPRILALAELMWHTGPMVPFETFQQKVLEKKQWFQAMGYTYGPGHSSK